MMATVNGHEVEPGCKVGGHLGIYATHDALLLAKALGWPGEVPPVLHEDEPGVMDDAEDWLNEHTEQYFVWEWVDGEFFLSQTVVGLLRDLPDGAWLADEEWTDIGLLEGHKVTDPEDAVLLVLPVASSDYTGSLVDAANRRWLLAAYEEEPFLRLTGMFGYDGLALRLEHVDRETAGLVLDDLRRMVEDYPVLDDETYQQEIDGAVDEALAGWALDDARHNLSHEGYDVSRLDAKVLADALERAVDAGADGPYDEGHGHGHVVLPMDAMLDVLRGSLPGRPRSTVHTVTASLPGGEVLTSVHADLAAAQAFVRQEWGGGGEHLDFLDLLVALSDEEGVVVRVQSHPLP